jgi:hypothetical protein
MTFWGLKIASFLAMTQTTTPRNDGRVGVSSLRGTKQSHQLQREDCFLVLFCMFVEI